MDISHTTFMGWTALDWAQFVALPTFLASCIAGGWNWSRKKSAGLTTLQHDATAGCTHNFSPTDRALDALATGVVIAPIAYNISKSITDVLKEKMSDHHLDQISTQTGLMVDPVTNNILDMTSGIASDSASNTHDIIHDAVTGISSILS